LHLLSRFQAAAVDWILALKTLAGQMMPPYQISFERSNIELSVIMAGTIFSVDLE
jgi:hypothetical protein